MEPFDLDSVLHGEAMYLPMGDEILAVQLQCLERLYDFNATRPTEQAKRTELLRIAYNRIINSADFKELAAQFPELQRFRENSIEHRTIYMLKDGENDASTLADAMEANGITVCSVHSHERLVELQKAVLDALAQANPEESDPEPEPEPGPDDDPGSDQPPAPEEP